MQLFNILSFLFILPNSKSQLYNANDNVTIFNKTSFESKFNNLSNDNWFIQFYHSYCGHCINFAPIFKNFLKEANYWDWIIKFGVVDCSTEKELCKVQKISHFPYFKIFLNKFDKRAVVDGITTSINHATIEDLFEDTISLVEAYFRPKSLLEYSDDTNSTRTPYLFLSGSYDDDLKRTVLMYHNRLKYNLYYQIKNISGFDLTFVTKSQVKETKFSNLKLLHNELDNYLKNLVVMKKPFTNQPNTTASLSLPNSRAMRFSTIYPVYNQDIFSSILYALSNDVTDEKLIKIENIYILKNFILKLSSFSGLNDNILQSFTHLLTQIEEKINSMKGRKKFTKSWMTMLELSKFPDFEPSWIGCNGSKPHYRRYPCGLWTTFHTLSINHYIKLQSSLDSKDSAINLIKAIREFIITFFSCRECAENFNKETEDFEDKINDSMDAVFYIWKIHNRVNKRIAKTPSEDPQFPKTAFPPESVCSKCRISTKLIWPNDDQWRMNKVFDYLIQHYSSINIIRFQSQPSLLLRTSTSILVSISSIDISLCVILSIFSSFIVIVAFFKFFRDSSFCRRRKNRKLFV